VLEERLAERRFQGEMHMTRMTAFGRKSRAVLAVGCAGLFLAVASVGAGGVAKVFTGGGYGSTPEGAIQGAIWDAEGSASAEQLYTCTLVGQPRIFGPSVGPRGGVRWNAEADLSCTP
jgi:hypothetical protein